MVTFTLIIKHYSFEMQIQALIAPDESNNIKEILTANKCFQTTNILERFSVKEKKT